MDIDRNMNQGGIEEAMKKISFCLDKLEKARHFRKGVNWGTEIVSGLVIEEMVGALINSEQVLINIKEEEIKTELAEGLSLQNSDK